MKRLLIVLMAGLLVAAVTLPALAWEFSMKGEYEQRLRYFARTGDSDLFGDATLQDRGFLGALDTAAADGLSGNQQAGLIGFAGPNYLRVNTTATQSNATMRVVRQGFSRANSDALVEDQRITMTPEIRVNQAIRVHGVYNIGGFRQKYANANGFGAPFERYYNFRSGESTSLTTHAIGSWEQFRATIQTPIGIISIGNKDFPFEIGQQFGYWARGDSMLLVIPYGPFRFLPTAWLARGATTDANAGTATATLSGTNPDGGQKNNFYGGFLVTYQDGPLDFGAGWIGQFYHQSKSDIGALDAAGNVTLVGSSPVAAGPWVGGATGAYVGGHDHDDRIMAAYLKYTNGRFFLNAMYLNGFLCDHYIGAAPRYSELTDHTVELGAMAGPAKLTLLYANGGGTTQNKTPNGQRSAGIAVGRQVIDPYQYLMFTTYGGGDNCYTNLFVNDELGHMRDAFTFAGRLDYAVAANLNTYVTYMWAHRTENFGQYKGGILSSGAAATTAQRTAWVTKHYGVPGEVNPVTGGLISAGSINPYVDNGFIGWEANAGFDWKVLEGMNFSMRYSYWQPGEWFTQAYQVVSRDAFGNIAVDGKASTAPSAIQALQGSFLINW